ncbi:hypothetical protein JCM10213_003538 [Rhodosporidiobolus nylandii]
MQSSLPPQAIDLIFSHLASYATAPTLARARCCRLSSSLLPHARRQLYRRLDFNWLRLDRHSVLAPTHSKLLESLEQHAHLVALVEELSCIVHWAEPSLLADEFGQDYDYMTIYDYEEQEDEWNEEWEAGFVKEFAVDIKSRLRVLFGLLAPTLRRLELPDPDGIMNASALLRDFHLPHLAHLETRDLRPKDLAVLPALTSLACTSNSLDDLGESSVSAPRLSALRLCHLGYKKAKKPLLPSFTSFTANSLATLACLTIPFDDSFSSALLSFTSLQHLTLTDPDVFSLSGTTSSSTLPPLPPSLRSLTLGLPCEAHRLPPSPTLSSTFLSTLSHPTLRRLAFTSAPFPASLYISLLTSTPAALPALAELNFQRAWMYRKACLVEPGWAGATGGVKDLSKVCRKRGVRLVLPLPQSVEERGWA